VYLYKRMFEFSEWAALALESGRFIDAGYGNEGKWGRSTVHSRSANSGEEMEILSGTTLSLGVYCQTRNMLTIDSICLPTFFWWSQFQGLGVNKVDKRTAFR
jgi:hypothetical protein